MIASNQESYVEGTTTPVNVLLGNSIATDIIYKVHEVDSDVITAEYTISITSDGPTLESLECTTGTLSPEYSRSVAAYSVSDNTGNTIVIETENTFDAANNVYETDSLSVNNSQTVVKENLVDDDANVIGHRYTVTLVDGTNVLTVNIENSISHVYNNIAISVDYTDATPRLADLICSPEASPAFSTDVELYEINSTMDGINVTAVNNNGYSHTLKLGDTEITGSDYEELPDRQGKTYLLSSANGLVSGLNVYTITVKNDTTLVTNDITLNVTYTPDSP